MLSSKKGGVAQRKPDEPASDVAFSTRVEAACSAGAELLEPVTQEMPDGIHIVVGESWQRVGRVQLAR